LPVHGTTGAVRDGGDPKARNPVCYVGRQGRDGPTSGPHEDPYTFLLKVDRPQTVAEVREVLDHARIPYRSGLLAGRRPSVIFSVPRERLEQARAAVAEAVDGEPGRVLAPSAQKFPWQAVRTVGSLILLHFLIVFWMIGLEDSGRSLLVWGALLKGRMVDEPWRLVTSLLLHIDPLHVFWNGASMMVFAVPLLGDLRWARTGLIYLASGIGGGVTALEFARAGTLIVGSSGAVAGLFGAWVVLTLGRTHLEPLTGRARIRATGIAMLFLPSLLSPITSTGHSVSVSSHLGGLATGMAIGALISTGLLRRMRAAAG
jgi:membrane associated rhomboid family serine protease